MLYWTVLNLPRRYSLDHAHWTLTVLTHRGGTHSALATLSRPLRYLPNRPYPLDRDGVRSTVTAPARSPDLRRPASRSRTRCTSVWRRSRSRRTWRAAARACLATPCDERWAWGPSWRWRGRRYQSWCRSRGLAGHASARGVRKRTHRGGHVRTVGGNGRLVFFATLVDWPSYENRNCVDLLTCEL